MSIEITLPKLGVEMTSAILAEWSVPDGADVAKDEVIATVETDKVSYEITSSTEGVVHRVAVEGDEYPVGAVLATVHSEDDGRGTQPEGAAGPLEEPSSETRPEEPSVTRESSSVERSGTRAENEAPILATPLARRIAKSEGIDLRTIVGTGRRGQIKRSDVENAIESESRRGVITDAPASDARAGAVEVPLPQLRRTIAKRMLSSLQTTAQMTDVREIDVSETLTLRRSMVDQLAETGFRPSVNTMYLKAVALTLRAVPELNVTFEDGHLLQHRSINLGMAVAVPDGLVVPVIRDADRLSLRELHEEIARLSASAREGRLQSSDLSDGTFTVTNIGSYGSHFGTPVLNPPQVAVLATGAVVERPVVRDGSIAIGEMAYFSLTVDHQIIDGETIGRFHGELARTLAAPYLLLVN